MHKKAEISSIILIYLLVIIVAGLTLYISLGGISDIKNIEKKIEISSFASTLENSLKAQSSRSVGSIDQVSLSLPSEVDTLCFIDEKQMFSPQASLELTKNKEIYKDKNLFFFPGERFVPVKIRYFQLNESPLCVKIADNKLNLKLTTTPNTTLVEAANIMQKSADCVIVPGSSVGSSDEKIDIVFLGYGYQDKITLAEDVDDYLSNHFFKTEPFRSAKGKFNIWMVDNSQPNCSIGSYIICDSMSVNKLASNCPNDYIIILVDKNKLRSSVRSSAISNMAKINTWDDELVLLHEFAHIFANLADEYTDQYYESWFDAKNYPNCDYANCPKWSSFQGTECIKGCSTNNFYRSVDVSIMRDYGRSNQYGVLNEEIIKNNLGEYK